MSPINNRVQCACRIIHQMHTLWGKLEWSSQTGASFLISSCQKGPSHSETPVCNCPFNERLGQQLHAPREIRRHCNLWAGKLFPEQLNSRWRLSLVNCWWQKQQTSWYSFNNVTCNVLLPKNTCKSFYSFGCQIKDENVEDTGYHIYLLQQPCWLYTGQENIRYFTWQSVSQVKLLNISPLMQKGLL